MNRIDEPLNLRSRRTRAALLDATWELLEQHGSDHVTMAAVAERAGVSRRAIYLHFGSRAELLLALHAHVDERLDLEASVRRVTGAADAVAALDAFVEHLTEFHPKIQRVDLALLRAGDEDPDVAGLVAQGLETWLEFCRSITRRLAEEHRLAEPWTVDTAADLLWHFMFPDVLERFTGNRRWPIERYREHLSVILRRTLVAEPAPSAYPDRSRTEST